MKSTIKIEFDYASKQPYIEVKIQNTEDLRDGMLKAFFQQNGPGTSLLRQEYHYLNETDPTNRIEVVRIYNDTQEHKIEKEYFLKIWPTMEDWEEDFKAIVHQEEGEIDTDYLASTYKLPYYKAGISPRKAYIEEFEK